MVGKWRSLDVPRLTLRFAGTRIYTIHSSTADHLPHSPSAVGHTDDDEFLSLFSVFSSSPSSGNQEDFEPQTPTSDLPTRLSPPCTTDDNHRWLSEQPSNDLTFPCIPSYDTDFSAVPCRDGTCKPSDLMPTLQDFRPSVDHSRARIRISPSSQSMSMRIGFSGDPSPDDAVVLVCSFLVSLPSPSSVIDQSKVGGGDRMGGSSRGMNS
jgi:hypothetical protein